MIGPAPPFGQLFRRTTSSARRARHNWAKGHYTEGAELIDRSSTPWPGGRVRAASVFPARPPMGGGTGAGMGAFLIPRSAGVPRPRCRRTRDPVAPVRTRSSAPQRALGAPARRELGPVLTPDNGRLRTPAFKLTTPTYGDLNHLIAAAVCGTTCLLRFPGQLNCDLRKLAVNMVRSRGSPLSASPLTPRGSQRRALTVPESRSSSSTPRTDVRRPAGRYLRAVPLRGRMSTKEVDERTFNVVNKNSSYFVEWIPNNVVGHCDIPKGLKMATTFIGNTTAVQAGSASPSSSRPRSAARCSPYTGEGMDEMGSPGGPT